MEKKADLPDQFVKSMYNLSLNNINKGKKAWLLSIILASLFPIVFPFLYTFKTNSYTHT
jgi:hypothetical protein